MVSMGISKIAAMRADPTMDFVSKMIWALNRSNRRKEAPEMDGAPHLRPTGIRSSG